MENLMSWKSVKDEMPEINTKVLLCIYTGFGGGFRFVMGSLIGSEKEEPFIGLKDSWSINSIMYSDIGISIDDYIHTEIRGWRIKMWCELPTQENLENYFHNKALNR